MTWVLYETQIKQGVSAGSIGRASKETWYLMDGAEHRKTWYLMDGAEHKKTWDLLEWC